MHLYNHTEKLLYNCYFNLSIPVIALHKVQTVFVWAIGFIIMKLHVMQKDRTLERSLLSGGEGEGIESWGRSGARGKG